MGHGFSLAKGLHPDLAELTPVETCVADEVPQLSSVAESVDTDEKASEGGPQKCTEERAMLIIRCLLKKGVTRG